MNFSYSSGNLERENTPAKRQRSQPITGSAEYAPP